ncbi:MAG: ABC transporter permease [Candidatus Woesearchaeota archaeon]
MAFKNLLSRRLRSWLTLIGIFAGIAAVVALISLGQGMQDAINDQFAGLGVNLLTITSAGVSYGPPGTTNYGALTSHDVTILKRINDVTHVIPRYIEMAILNKNNLDIYSYVVSMPGGEEEQILIKSGNLELEEGGSFFEKDSSNKAVLGYSVAYNSDYTFKVGDKFTIKGHEFKVSGIMKKKGNFATDGAVLISTKTLEELFDVENNYNVIVVVVDELTNIDETKEIVERTLRKDRNQKIGEEDFKVSSIKETINMLNDILLTVQVLLIGIAAISLLVGGIGIANTMYTAVLERRSEIGIMKAVGATNQDILILFLIESGLLGLAGGILGLIIGITISKSVEFFAFQYFGESILKASIPITLIVGSLLFAFLVGAISGTLPAKSASKMKIVDTFKN